MSTATFLKHVRWVWTLPILAVAATTVLVSLAVHQNAAFVATHAGLTDTPGELQAPATLFAQILNGPGFFFPSPFGPLRADWIRLPGVALFWAWIGWQLDERLRVNQKVRTRSRVVRTVVASTMFLLAALFVLQFIRCLHTQQLLPQDPAFQSLLWNAPWEVRLHLTASGWYVGLIWSLVYLVYFARQLFSILKRRS